jgi:hypothetical protein
MRNPRTEKLALLIYLLWMLFMAYYWLSLFFALTQDTFSAWMPTATSLALIVAYAVAHMKAAKDASAVLLVLLFLHSIFFSWLALYTEPVCSCFVPGIGDLVPVFISMGMTAILFVSANVKRIL